MCVYVYVCVPSAHGSQNRVLAASELELQMVVVGAGSQHLGPQEEQQVLLDDRPFLQLYAQILILAPRSVNTFSAITPRELMCQAGITSGLSMARPKVQG